MINTEQELEERLSRPTPADAAAMRALDGDILILGAGGKMGPSLARLARRACDEAKVAKRIVAVARFSQKGLRDELAAEDIETISGDLLDPDVLTQLPQIKNVLFMAARKFGTTGDEHMTWAMNTYLPGLVGGAFRDSRIVAFSSGNVYPLRAIAEGGATEATPVAPVGEYAQSVVGRERMFDYWSRRCGTPVALLRLNYAVELRYGVLVDLALAVFERRPIDLRMGLVNVIWQGDANSNALGAFVHCQSPPKVLNIAGPETLSVRHIGEEFGKRFGIAPVFVNAESTHALLNNAAEAHKMFGYPTVTVAELMDWIAHWIAKGGSLLNKPTHFEAMDGKF